MKIITNIVIVLLLLSNNIKSQFVTGRLVDENSSGLAAVELKLYAGSTLYNTTSDSSGMFSFSIITGVEDNRLPLSYSVSDNFPNPFNPTTRIVVTLPKAENVKVEVFNLLGESVTDIIEQFYDAGINYINIELEGLPNGFYVSKITIGDKYTIAKKMMLIYGSQHLASNGGWLINQSNKINQNFFEIVLDSLVATSSIIGRKTFTDLPVFTGGILDLGNEIVERYCPGIPIVEYDNKTYNTIQIGNQCWLKQNLDVGILINESEIPNNNGIIEKYCYDNNLENCDVFGGLYDWNEAMQYVLTQGAQGICPDGWHIPTYDEFLILMETVNNDGNVLKEIGQGTENGAGTNISGFSALLTGILYYNDWGFFGLGTYAYFWTSTGDPDLAAIDVILLSTNSNIDNYISYKVNGLCIRCIKD